MKKFMFSAVAMIAFVGSSMANTAEVTESSEIKSKNSTVVELDCKQAQKDAVVYAKNVMGMNDDDATKAGYSIYFFCMGEKVGQMTLHLGQQN
jgi:hypothetical protein